MLTANDIKATLSSPEPTKQDRVRSAVSAHRVRPSKSIPDVAAEHVFFLVIFSTMLVVSTVHTAVGAFT